MDAYNTINMEQYARKAHFAYFSTMANPYVGVTCPVDITRFLAKAKEEHRPFFLSFLWTVAASANAVPEFRQRIYNSGIIEFAECPTSHTVAKEDGTYSYCRLNCRMPLTQFLPYAAERQRIARAGGGIAETEEDALSALFISTLPWLYYTALVQPVPSPADSNPRITWGKYTRQEGKTVLPLSVLCHHALVDGRHIAAFYDDLQAALERI
ncbi:MAG: CatA-like O-acetyltransferase [Eubacteriales bacterium]|nr:CatA-like O-acetyltransferase [Eubacteriales bacterium]